MSRSNSLRAQAGLAGAGGVEEAVENWNLDIRAEGAIPVVESGSVWRDEERVAGGNIADCAERARRLILVAKTLSKSL